MPLICKEMVELLDVGGANSSSANHSSLSNFAFLYGVFPTAPSVALYASQFNMELEVVSSRLSCFYPELDESEPGKRLPISQESGEIAVLCLCFLSF